MNKCYAVVDTNVIVSALISKNYSPPRKILKAIMAGYIIPLYHPDIILEYKDVLSSEKFHLKEKTITTILNAICQFGLEVMPKSTGEILTDMDDLIFYEVAMEKQSEEAFLITGNQKHYPIKDFIVTPAQMMSILDEKNKSS
jgi:uncharacterized protein